MATTYCEREDIEAILGYAGVLACIDDDGDGVESVTESGYVTSAIERAAADMNAALGAQYILSELSGNAWCKWANATLAAYRLRTRKNNPPEQALVDDVVDIRERLSLIRWGREQVPEQRPSANHLPTVTNFRPELGKEDNPIRVSVEESTGNSPAPGINRNVAKLPGTL